MKTSALILSILIVATACSSGPPQGAVTSDGFPAPDKALVFDAARRAMDKQGFSPDLDASSLETGTLVSRWKLSLQPFSGQGYRDQATMTIKEVPGRANYFTVDSRVIRQMNDNMEQPSNPIAADWSTGERVAELEQILNQRVEMFFLPTGVSSGFRERYSMPAQEDLRIPTPQPDDR
ncbi:MAG: hypothetical protein ACYTG6_01065 [Planctomycetota bacterium]|jgi:hypothetical protein